MGASRESRPSERTLDVIWSQLRGLSIEVWLPRHDDAEESAGIIKRHLDKMIAEMRAESFSQPQQPMNIKGLVDSPYNRI